MAWPILYLRIQVCTAGTRNALFVLCGPQCGTIGDHDIIPHTFYHRPDIYLSCSDLTLFFLDRILVSFGFVFNNFNS